MPMSAVALGLWLFLDTICVIVAARRGILEDWRIKRYPLMLPAFLFLIVIFGAPIVIYALTRAFFKRRAA